MTDLETSFTVEVLRFREGADPEALAESVSSFFGISLEEGRRLVSKAPIRVKRGASPEITQRLVKQLRKLGAEVLVRNEQTGEERTYALKDAPPSQPAAPEPAAPEPAASEPAPRRRRSSRTTATRRPKTRPRSRSCRRRPWTRKRDPKSRRAPPRKRLLRRGRAERTVSARPRTRSALRHATAPTPA